MGEDWGYCFPQRQFDWQSHDFSYLGALFNLEHPRSIPSLMNPASDMVSVKRGLPVYPSLLPPYVRGVDQANEPHGCFDRLPHFQQASFPKEKLPNAPCNYNHEANVPKVESGCSQRRFLVFDRTGDRTTMIFSSGHETSIPCFTSSAPKLVSSRNLMVEDPATKENPNLHLREFSSCQIGENDGTDLHSEMPEDTDQLNALLCSDDDSEYATDDEVTSTAHSPSIMTVRCNQEALFKGSTEEVASSGGPTKKRKFSDGSDVVLPALRDTGSSAKPIRNSPYEDDAESRCDGGLYRTLCEVGSESSNKKMRKERIRDTVNILQDMIPGGKGKEAIMVLDEAISYLKSLKLKAKALGLDVP